MNTSINVLFIEDNPGDVRLVKEELRSASSKTIIQLEWVDRLEKGLERIGANSIDAILLDLSLPDSAGLDTLQRVLAQAPHIPVIVMTGQADEETAMHAVQSGAQDYLIKGQVDGRLLTRSIQYSIQRKQTEEALRKSEERFRLIVISAPSAMIVVDKEGIITLVNSSAEKLFGYNTRELLGRPMELLVPEHFRENHKRLYQKYLSQPRAIAVGIRRNLYGLHKAGHEIPLEIGLAPYESSDGVHILALINDITERKQAEAAVAAMQKRFQALIENAPDGIALLGLDGKLRQVTPSTQQILGYTTQEAEGQDPAFMTHPADLPALLELLSDLIQNPGKVARTQYRFRHKDGSWRWLESTISNLINEPGVEAIVFNYRDMTDRKQTEEALQEKERLLSDAQRIGRIGSWSYDIVRDIVQFSDEMYQLFDILPGGFHNNMEGLLGLIYSVDRPAVTAWVDQIKAGSPVRELSFRVLGRTGELRYMECWGAVKFDPESNSALFVGTLQDTTERKLADIQIRQQIQRLNALREIDRAISSSFDLRITLNTVLSQVITQLQANAAIILLLDAEGQTFVYATGQGLHIPLSETTHVPLDGSHAGRVARERRLVKIENLKDQPEDVLLTTLLAGEDFVCYYGVPLIAKGKVIGVLEVFYRLPPAPYPEWLDFLNTLAGQAAIAIENTKLFENLQQSNYELSQAYDATIEGWSRALDLRDKETEGHTLRVTERTMDLARRFGFNDEELLHIRRGALLHDIGKMGVPDHILLKPEPLTAEELAIMEKHAQYAYDLLKPIAFLQPALDIPYCHHEKWDGTGYPRGLKGEEIPMAARLFAIIDVWDALTSDRPYRPAWSEAEALNYIREQSGRHLDPRVVELFFKVVK